MSKSGKDHHTYAISMDGGSVHEVGEADGFGYYALIVDEEDRWWVCHEDAMGFWYADEYANQFDAEFQWALIEAAYTDWIDEGAAVKAAERRIEGD